MPSIKFILYLLLLHVNYKHVYPTHHTRHLSFPSPTTEQTANAPRWIQPLIQDKRQINARQMAGRGGGGWEMSMLRLTEPFILPK